MIESDFDINSGGDDQIAVPIKIAVKFWEIDKIEGKDLFISGRILDIQGFNWHIVVGFEA